MTHQSLQFWKCVNACPVVQETGSETLAWALRIILNLHGLRSTWYRIGFPSISLLYKKVRKKKYVTWQIQIRPLVFIYSYIYIYRQVYIYNVLLYNVYCMKKTHGHPRVGNPEKPHKEQGGGGKKKNLGSEEEKNPRLVPRDRVKSP